MRITKENMKKREILYEELFQLNKTITAAINSEDDIDLPIDDEGTTAFDVLMYEKWLLRRKIAELHP